MSEVLNKISVSVEFECDLRIESRKEMQAAGRMVCALYRPNPQPHLPDIRREWEGDTVYDLRLMWMGQQIHRVMSDSLKDAERLMREGIVNTFWAAQRQQAGIGFEREQFNRINDEFGELGAFIGERFKAEIERGEHSQFKTITDVVKHYLGGESGTKKPRSKKK